MCHNFTVLQLSHHDSYDGGKASRPSSSIADSFTQKRCMGKPMTL